MTNEQINLVQQQAFELMKSYALQTRRDGESLYDDSRMAETTLWSEDLVTVVHLLRGEYGELYDANIPLYLDHMGNLYQGHDEHGAFIEALPLDLVYEVMR